MFQISPQKLLIGENIKNVFENNDCVLVLHHSGIGGEEWDSLRYDLSKINFKLKMFPNRITKKVLESTKYSTVSMLFNSSTILAYGKDPDVKLVLELVKHQPKLVLLGGLVENMFLSKNQLIDYSKLPDLDTTRAHLLQTLTQPSQQLFRYLKQSPAQLSMSLEQLVKQSESDQETVKKEGSA